MHINELSHTIVWKENLADSHLNLNNYLYTASTIRPCSRDDPQLERCIIDAVYKIRPLLVHGDLGDGYKTPPLEPLALDDIELGRSSQFQAVFQDLEAIGGSNFIIDRLMYIRPNNAKMKLMNFSFLA